MTDMDRFIEAANALAEGLEKVAGYRGKFNMPFPEKMGQEYGAFAVVTAREALTGYRAAREAITKGPPPATSA